MCASVAVTAATLMAVFPYRYKETRHLRKSLVDQMIPPYAEAEAADATRRNKKIVAARSVADFVSDGMIVGMGTGTTCFMVVEEIGRRVRNGELTDIKVIPCSVETKKHCIAEGIPTSSLSFASGNLDVMIDGADEIDPNMDLIKGGSGSFLREKMMQNYSNQVVIVADDRKLVKALGTGHPVAVELIAWDYERTIRIIEDNPSLPGCRGVLRRGNITSPIPDGLYPAITDNGNFIVDLYFYKKIPNVGAASAALDGVPGVVEHGLFSGQATTILVATDELQDPVRILGHYPLDVSAVEEPWWKDQPLKRPLCREAVDNRQPGYDPTKTVMSTPWMRLHEKYYSQGSVDSAEPDGGASSIEIDSKSGQETTSHDYLDKKD